MKLLLVGLGGFTGSVMRYLAGSWVHEAFPAVSFPIGTLFVNVTGCLIIGFLGGLSEFYNVFTPHVRLFVFIGVLGGFTTFSTFGNETMALMRDGQFLWASMNVLLSVGAGLFAVWLGQALSRFA
jgi:CrcB protein